MERPRRMWALLTVALLYTAAGLPAVADASDEHAAKCCAEGFIVDLAQQHCSRKDSNSSQPLWLNCTNRYLIFRDIEEDVYVDDQGSLVDGMYQVLKEGYCLTDALDTDGIHTVFVVCFTGEETVASMYISKAILMLISVFFLVVTLYIYGIIPDLRETQDKVTSMAVFCLAVFMFLLSLVQLRTTITTNAACSVLAFLMYFFLISYFAWLNMVMANMWKLTVARQWKIKERFWYILNYIYAFTVSVTLTLMVYVYHTMSATIGEISCWFRTPREQSYFVYLPLSIMLGINIFLFAWTSFHLHVSDDGISPDRRKALRYKCMLYLKLFLLSGLLWVFEIISFHLGEGMMTGSWFWIIVDSVNCLHGVLIFFVLIVWRQRIKRELSGRRILCFRGPARWADLKDDEQEQLHDDGREAGRYDLIIK